MNSAGTASRALIASRSAVRRSSSSQPSRTGLASWGVDRDLTKRHQRAGLAQQLQAGGALRSDAADRDAQRGADLVVGTGRVGQQHAEQPLAMGRQLGE